MKLVFIYGPPAVGKLTIAKELAAATGYKLFHNHLTRDLVRDIYADELHEQYQLVNDLRTTVFSYAAQHDTDMIFTFVYENIEDDATVQGIVESVMSQGGEVIFVELKASTDALLERVSNESRKDYAKLTDPVILKSLIETDRYGSVPYDRILKVDTSQSDSSQAVKIIIDFMQSLEDALIR